MRFIEYKIPAEVMDAFFERQNQNKILNKTYFIFLVNIPIN